MGSFFRWVSVSILVAGLGCGSNSNNGTSSSGRTASNGGQCPGSAKGQTCTGEAAFESCMMNACGTQYKECFGNNYASGDFTGGTCADFMNCELKCPCDATADTCEQNCVAVLLTSATGAACSASLTKLETCTTGAKCTEPVCTGGTTTATTTSSSTATATKTTTSSSTATGTTSSDCSKLVTCCSSLASTGGSDAVQGCQMLQAYQAQGLCK